MKFVSSEIWVSSTCLKCTKGKNRLYFTFFLQIRSSRSKWMCEAMFGQMYDLLYPCHICYTVYKSEEELREHFRLVDLNVVLSKILVKHKTAKLFTSLKL